MPLGCVCVGRFFECVRVCGCEGFTACSGERGRVVMIMRQHGKLFVCVELWRGLNTPWENKPLSVQHPLSAEGKAKLRLGVCVCACFSIGFSLCILYHCQCVYFGEFLANETKSKQNQKCITLYTCIEV